MNLTKRYPLIYKSLLLSGSIVALFTIYEKVYWEKNRSQKREGQIQRMQETVKMPRNENEVLKESTRSISPVNLSPTELAFTVQKKDSKTGEITIETHLPKGKSLYNEDKLSEVAESANITDTDHF